MRKQQHFSQVCQMFSTKHIFCEGGGLGGYPIPVIFGPKALCLVLQSLFWSLFSLYNFIKYHSYPFWVKSFKGQSGGLLAKGGHYGLGGHLIKNAKGQKKPRQQAQNSGKTQERPEVSKEILLSWQLSSFRWISFDFLVAAPSVVDFRSFTEKIKIC